MLAYTIVGRDQSEALVERRAALHDFLTHAAYRLARGDCRSSEHYFRPSSVLTSFYLPQRLTGEYRGGRWIGNALRSERSSACCGAKKGLH